MTDKRNVPLDIFRGLVILNMMFVDAPPDFENIYKIFVHSPWEGITFADLAFPGFVFAMGASLAFSLNKKSKKIMRTKVWLKKICIRTAILFFLGILFNIFPQILNFMFNQSPEIFNNIRILGVFQRLALVYFFSSLIIRFLNGKFLLTVAFFILIFSSLFMRLYSPNAPFLQEDNLSIFIDLYLLGSEHILYSNPPYEPEGIYGTLNSVASMLLGIKSAKLLIDEKYRPLIFLGTVAIFSGGIWSVFDIVSKPLWSSPYVLFTTGFDIYLLVAIAFLYKKYQAINKIFFPILGFGRNPLFFYFATNFMLILFYIIQCKNGQYIYSYIYQNTIKGFVSDAFSSSLFAFVWCLLWFPLAYYFYKKNIIIKI